MNMSLDWQRYHDPVASLKTFKSLLDIFQYLHTLGRKDTFNLRPCSHYYKNKKVWRLQKFENFVSTNFLFLQPRSHLRQAKFFVYLETSIKGTLIGHVRERRWPCPPLKKGTAPNLLDGVFELRWQLRKFWSVKKTVRTRNGFLLTEFLRSVNRALYSK